MPTRDSKGRFLPKDDAGQAAPVSPARGPGQAGHGAGLQRQLWEDLVVTLLERIAYNTAQTHLTFEEYLCQRVYKERSRADHSAAD